MDSKVCGPGCAACEMTLKIAEAAITARGVIARVSKGEGFQERARPGVFTTRALVMDGQGACINRAPGQQEAAQWLG